MSGAKNLQCLKAPGYIHGSQRACELRQELRIYRITKGLLQLKLVLSCMTEIYM